MLLPPFEFRTDHINIRAANMPDDHIARENHSLVASEKGGLNEFPVFESSAPIDTAACASVVIIINSQREAAINTKQVIINCSLVSFEPATYATALNAKIIVR
jgi:hypothetical protein